ncbi:hypothetical protein ACJ41O_001172 [Fusarium nematophilum]
MQFKFAAIVTSLLAAYSTQAAAHSSDNGSVDDFVTSLDNIAYWTNTLTTTFKKLKKNTLTTKGFAGISGAAKLALTISVLDTTPIFDEISSDPTSQEVLCEDLDYLHEGVATLLAAINSKLPIIAGSDIAPSIQIVLGLLEAAADAIQAKISPHCSFDAESTSKPSRRHSTRALGGS